MVLVGLFWTVNHHTFARLEPLPGDLPSAAMAMAENAPDDSSDGHWCVDLPSDDSEQPQPGAVVGNVRDLPACADIEQSLGSLRQARQQMLESASTGDPKSATIAQDRYRRAISDVQAGFSKLQALLAPDQFGTLRDEIVASVFLDSDAPFPWELGRPSAERSL